MLAQNENLSETATLIQAIFDAQKEWFLANAKGFALQTDEIEIESVGGKLSLSCLTERGWQTWGVLDWEQTGNKLIFETAPKINSRQTRLEFIPRVSVANLREDLNAARLKQAHDLAEIARQQLSNLAKTERVTLNQARQRGRYGSIARILLILLNRQTIAVCGSIADQTDAESFLSHALLWFSKTQQRRKIDEFWLIGEPKATDKLIKFHALLRDGWRNSLKIYELSADTDLPTKKILQIKEKLSFAELWREKPKKIIRPKSTEFSRTTQEIIKLAPEEIDVVRSKNGETLRFRGLPFARVREILGEERAWFGIEGKKRQILEEKTLLDFDKLLENLRQRRRADVDDRRNFLYRAAPEAWLESILRRDISRLDPNLILAPLYAQFRLTQKQSSLDLLALRTDGRLAVIELKVSSDREHIFQGVEYWRQVELQRRAGHIQNARLFNNLKILDEPPLVYLVAPLMSFHPDFEFLAKSVSPEIEIWRFDLNEDWRHHIKIARRQRVN
jgi:hypothetical protein